MLPPSVFYFLRRVGISLLTLFIIAAATFALMHAIPGGPYSGERKLPAQIEANIARKYHLDESVWKQFARYLGGCLRGDLGPSFSQEDRTTNEIIRDGFPKSATLGLTAFLFAVAIGVPAGTLAALWRTRLVDRAVMLAAVFGVSVPAFILASLLQYWVSYRFNLAPAAGWGESPLQLVLPALALAGVPAAFLSRLVRASLISVIEADFMRTAKAKGLSPLRVIVRHGLRNALLPAVTYAGPLLAALLTGSFVVESIFAIPGLGQYFVTSITNRDYTVIMGVTLFYSALLIAANVTVDAVYAMLDPRISR